MKKTFDVRVELAPDALADAIVKKFVAWESGKANWERTYKDNLQHVYAIDSKEIDVAARFPWSNHTHIPKFCQIYDLLLTMYDEALFSSEDYIVWTSPSLDEVSNKKTRIMVGYAKKVLEDADFRQVMSKLLSDYILAGNAFATPVWTGDKALLVRQNPLEVYFDPYATSYRDSPKIFRKRIQLGELKNLSVSNEALKKAFDHVVESKKKVMAAKNNGDSIINNEGIIAGVGCMDIFNDMDSVEILTFVGDLYDITTDTYHENTVITIADRHVLLEEKPLEDYAEFFKAGWRDRADILWSMSPLSNLLGIQYRIDFLENKRADVFDFISNPVLKTKGDISLPESLEPGTVLQLPVDGDAAFISPDSTALMADTYVENYMNLMDLMAGTPREVVGWRSPGEKTAFEYRELVTAAMRMFNKQIRKFEKELFEPCINALVKTDIANRAGQQVTVKTTDPQTGMINFETLSIDELANDQGELKAQGSTIYAERERVIQTLMQLGNSAFMQDPAVKANISPAMLGKVLVTMSGLDKFPNLYKKDAWINESAQQQVDAEKAQRPVDRARVESVNMAEQGI